MAIIWFGFCCVTSPVPCLTGAACIFVMSVLLGHPDDCLWVGWPSILMRSNKNGDIRMRYFCLQLIPYHSQPAKWARLTRSNIHSIRRMPRLIWRLSTVRLIGHSMINEFEPFQYRSSSYSDPHCILNIIILFQIDFFSNLILLVDNKVDWHFLFWNFEKNVGQISNAPFSKLKFKIIRNGDGIHQNFLN